MILELKIFSDSKDFIFKGTIFHNFAPRLIMDSVPKKTVSKFLVGIRTPLLSSWTGFSKNWKISFIIVGEMPFLTL